jgi:hypothetical protein
MIEEGAANLIIQFSQNREVRVDHLQSRILPRLVQDTIHCLWLAHDHVDHAHKSRIRRVILALRQAEVRDPVVALSTFRDLSPHLLRVARMLEDMDRPCTARTVRRVRDRLEHLTSQADASTHPLLASLRKPDSVSGQVHDNASGPDV